MSQQHQQNQQQQPKRTRRPEDIYVLVSSADHVTNRLRKLAAEKFPGSRVVEEVPFARLTDQNELVAVAEHPDTREPIVTQPIDCSKYWETSADNYGMVNQGQLIRELATRLSPVPVHLMALREGKLRLGYV